MKKWIFYALLWLPVMSMAQSLVVHSDKKGRLGYFDESGNKVISCQYEEAEPFIDGVARVRKNGKYGLINERGKAVGGLKYTVMEPYEVDGYYLICMGGSEAKPKDKISSRVNLPASVFQGSTLYPIKGGKWGLMDRQGKIVVKPSFDELSSPINGVVYVSKGGKLGFLNDRLEPVQKPVYTFMGSFNNLDLCWVMKGGKLKQGRAMGGKMGVINRQGQVVVPLKFSCVSTFYPSNDPVYASDLPGLFESAPFRPMPDSDQPYLWFMSKRTMAGLVDKYGNVVVPERKYQLICKPTDGMMRFKITRGKRKTYEEKSGFLNLESGKEYFMEDNFVYYPFRNGLSKVVRNDSCLYFFVNQEFQEVSERYTTAFDFHNGFCVVGRGGKFGLLGPNAREVVPVVYENVNKSVGDGLLGVTQGDGWGYITTDNRQAIPFVYEGVGIFRQGYASVKLNGKWGQIDRQNRFVLPAKWEDFIVPDTLPTPYYWVKQADQRYYYFDVATQKVIFPVQGKGFNQVEHFGSKGYARVKSDTSYGAVLSDGSLFVPLAFDDLDHVDLAVFYLQKNQLPAFREVDMRRFKIILRGTSNSYYLHKRVPNSEWDY